jgi:formylmethanofuran dehydrogenase subunit C
MLTLTYRAATTLPVEVFGLVPTALRDRTLAELERLPVQHGNRHVALAECFAVAGDPRDERLTFVGDLAGVHGIGARMDGGVVRVEGNAGRHAGSEMRGGELRIAGHAGDWLGAEMHRGLIDVEGDAGNHAGSAYRGSSRGMTGGTLLIRGNAGSELGHSLRRGLIAVGGDVGDVPCLNMIAGSVIVGGTVGMRAAAGMRRGTLAVLGRPPKLLPTFRPAGVTRPLFLRLYFATLRRLGFPVAAECDAADFRLYAGDLLGVGKGELLVREA